MARAPLAVWLLALGCSEAPNAPPCAAPAAVRGRVPYHECASAGVCPRARVPNDPQRPVWRITYLRPVAPAGIANAAVEAAVNLRIAQGSFLWALRYDLGAGTLQTGGLDPGARTEGSVGLGLLDGQFGFFRGNAVGMGDPGRYDPVRATVTVAGGRATSGEGTPPLRLPVYNLDGTLFTELPLTNFRAMDVHLSADRGCVGEGRPEQGVFAEHTSAWNTVDGAGTSYGTLVGDLSADEARTVNVLLAGATVPLCDLLAGVACSTPREQWPKQPDTMLGTTPAWRLRADFAAVSVRLRP